MRKAREESEDGSGPQLLFIVLHPLNIVFEVALPQTLIMDSNQNLI